MTQEASSEPHAQLEKLGSLEKWWLRIGMLMLVAFLAAVGVDAVLKASTMSSGMRTIAPQDVMITPPFNKPGVYRNKSGGYDAVVVAYAFGFLPKADLVVPAGKPIRFRVASVDVVHGFQIPGKTNVNLEVLPGHVSEVTQTFDTPGRYLILCHEYCGSGHHFMTGHIRVVKPSTDLKNPPAHDGSPDTNKAEGMAAMDSMESYT